MTINDRIALYLNNQTADETYWKNWKVYAGSDKELLDVTMEGS